MGSEGWGLPWSTLGSPAGRGRDFPRLLTDLWSSVLEAEV